MLKEIEEAIFCLESNNCRRENLLVCMSPIVARVFDDELRKRFDILQHNLNFGSHSCKQIFGVKVKDDWPYNEVVVYDKIHTCLYPELLIKIPIQVNVQTKVSKG